MWLFAVKYLHLFFAQRVLGKEREVDLFLSFHEAFQVHVQKLSAAILHFLGFGALLSLKIKPSFLLTQMMLHFLNTTLTLNDYFLY